MLLCSLRKRAMFLTSFESVNDKNRLGQLGTPYKIGDGSTLPIKIGLARPVADYHSAWRIRHPETRDRAQTVPSWDLYHELAYIF